MGSLLVHVTLSPTLTVATGGTNVKFWMVTVWLAANAALGSRAPQIEIRKTTTRRVRLRAIR
jgi:hypothetical protein